MEKVRYKVRNAAAISGQLKLREKRKCLLKIYLCNKAQVKHNLTKTHLRYSGVS